eukprot:TRINITY_DN8035_c0_g3_i1.p1 TRINITY_DN8035_c0_g3~~TRINITY_DN8035_c0_g3_i1.p1  ORF type:complete len:719 (-),score=136.31 TRINITY_DN8035_c0_g3_i1:103-2112(-)
MSYKLDPKATDRSLEQTPLFFAARQGNEEACKFLLDQGCKVDHKDELRSQSALFYAAHYGQLKCASLLIERKAELNARDKHEQTPLFWAARSDDTEMLKMLLKAKADPKVSSALGANCLFDAHADVVKFLVQEANCNVNHQDQDLRTPLIAAAMTGSIQKVRTLIELKADVNMKDSNDWSCLFHAVKKGSLEVLEYLVFTLYMDINVAEKTGCPLIRFAQKYCNYAAVAVLEERKKEDKERLQWQENVAVELSEMSGSSSSSCSVPEEKRLQEKLHNAVKSGTVEQVEALLKQGVKPAHVRMALGQNLAFLAAARASADNPDKICKLLGDHGLDLDKVDSQWSQTPLYFAVRKESRSSGIACARVLIEWRADINRQDLHGQTPLFYAAQRHETACVEALIKARASVNVKDLNRQTALVYAVRVGAAPTVKLLLDSEADPEVRDTNRRTPIWGALSAHVAELLLERGSNINAQDENGRGCLFFHIENHLRSHEGVLRMLTELKADVDLLDKNDETVLFTAARIKEGPVATKMLQLLINEYRMKIDRRNSQRQLPADVAVSTVARKLLQVGDASAPNLAPPVSRPETKTKAPAGIKRKGSSSSISAKKVEAPAKEDKAPEVKKMKMYEIVFKDAKLPRCIRPGMPTYDAALRSLLRKAPWLDGWDGKFQKG